MSRWTPIFNSLVYREYPTRIWKSSALPGQIETRRQLHRIQYGNLSRLLLGLGKKFVLKFFTNPGKRQRIFGQNLLMHLGLNPLITLIPLSRMELPFKQKIMFL